MSDSNTEQISAPDDELNAEPEAMPAASLEQVGDVGAVVSTKVSINEDLRNTIRRLPGVAPLLLPQVVRELKLTDAQQSSLRELNASAAKALRQIDRESAGRGRQETSALRAKRLAESREEAVKLLDPNQQEQWKALTQ